MLNPKQVFLGCSFQKRTSTYIHLAQDAAEEFGASLVFGDNNPSAVQIRDTAFRLIETSRVVVLDLSRESVNVGVEYGFAQGLKKKHVYLLAQKPAFGAIELPAMFRGLQYKPYRGLDGFNDQIAHCLKQHFVRGRTFMDTEAEFEWLGSQIWDVIEDVGEASRNGLATLLNAHAPDITQAADPLVRRGVLGREANGPDPIYFRPDLPRKSGDGVTPTGVPVL